MMKKTLLITLSALMLLSSCTIKLETESSVPRPESRQITITASQEGGTETRTVLDEDLIHVLWTPEDKINLFYQDQSACFEYRDYEITPIARFSGSLSIDVVTGGDEQSELEQSYFWGLYPYDENARYYADFGYVETSLPDVQMASKNTFSEDLFITLGRSSSWNMPFYNVCSGLRFTVDQEGITSVILRSNSDQPLAGRFYAGFDPETERPMVMEVTDKSTAITVYPPEGEYCFHPDVYYYIVTLPGTHDEGITIELSGLPNEAYITTQSSVTFKRSRFLTTNLTADKYYADYLPLESIDLNIENEGVQRYLNEVDYSDDLINYTESYISHYVSGQSDKPAPVRFNWKTTSQRTLTITDTKTGEIVYEGDASSLTTEIYNLIPGRKYSYSVVGEDMSWNSTFTPKGALRMIQSSTSNFRDLGGWTGEDNKTIVYGRIYRGAQINSSDENLFNSLGIVVDLDLRGIPGNPNPVFDESLVHWENIKVYQFMYNGSQGYTAEKYREALSYVISCLSEEKNVYFHCIGGADRTGTLAFLIEALLGVSENDMNKDYELTSFYDTRERNDTKTRPFKQLVFYLKTFEGETMQEKVTAWATTGDNALSVDQIDLLKSLLLE